MPKDEDIPIVIGEMTVPKSEFDVKLSALEDAMVNAVKDVFKKQSGMVLKKASDKPTSGFKVSGNIKSLKKETRDGVDLVICVVSIALGELPKDHLVPGKLEGTGGTDITKKLQSDVEFAVTKATQGAATMAIKQIKNALK